MSNAELIGQMMIYDRHRCNNVMDAEYYSGLIELVLNEAMAAVKNVSKDKSLSLELCDAVGAIEALK